ncbi:MAG: FAD-dependent thymidylate synthase [candidate division Zixibacteria bacterium RBG_16_50_21]|nr:MAG: FAD-dependent thymidylate synthase [candidate division Zixibacteria bacterium RBG_16_50_21]
MSRLIVPEAEEILEKEYKCLDKGFVTLVDYMGGDESIVQAARVSYGKGTKTVSDDRGLIRYLMRHDHTTPFEMAELKFHCKMPIFVAREWIRHRTASVNEYSLRYSEPEGDFYVPELEAIGYQAKNNRQGRSDEPVSEDTGRRFQEQVREISELALSKYKEMNQAGVARELARMVLPVNFYTRWYWKIDLHNLFHFLRLRLDQRAQYEIRVYAQKMAEITKKVAPVAYEAFEDYKLKSLHLSKLEVEAFDLVLEGMEAEEACEKAAFKKGRERNEFKEKLEILLKRERIKQ